MLDHVSLGVSELQRAMRFYDAVMAALGAVRVWTREGGAGYGSPGGDEKLALFVTDGAMPSPGMHLAFSARNEEAVRAFPGAALASGGTDDGAPGPRPRYGPGYFAAFVLDPDGHRLEAVFHSASR